MRGWLSLCLKTTITRHWEWLKYNEVICSSSLEPQTLRYPSCFVNVFSKCHLQFTQYCLLLEDFYISRQLIVMHTWRGMKAEERQVLDFPVIKWHLCFVALCYSWGLAALPRLHSECLSRSLKVVNLLSGSAVWRSYPASVWEERSVDNSASLPEADNELPWRRKDVITTLSIRQCYRKFMRP